MDILVITLALAPMIISDIRTRTINVLWLIVFVIVQLYIYGFSNILYNTILLLLMFSGVFVYLFLRYGIKTKLTKYLGIGDILFLVALTPAFEVRLYVYFLIIGFVFSTIYYLFIEKSKTVPLVSTLSVSYIIYCLWKDFLQH